VATFEIHHGDNRDVLKTLADNSVDSVVTDPPYELGFMGKSWDASGIAYSVELWKEVLRVLKPGGHLLAFSGSRTYHRMVVAIEDAGFEIRDQIMWIYGSGFPKSLDISKSIDKKPEMAHTRQFKLWLAEQIENSGKTRNEIDAECGFTACSYDKTDGKDGWSNNHPSQDKWTIMKKVIGLSDEWDWIITDNLDERGFIEPTGGLHGGTGNTVGKWTGAKQLSNNAISPDAKQWQGWGTALKPAHEPVVVARKPLIGTVAANVLTFGTGGLNIEATRVASDDGFQKAWDKPVTTNISAPGGKYISEGNNHKVDLSDYAPSGRWPANVIHDGSDEVVELFPNSKGNGSLGGGEGGIWTTGNKQQVSPGYTDSGSAARFFYCAKASKKDRNEGLDGFEAKFSPTMGNGIGIKEHDPETATKKQNHHPTVKPTDLMRYLCRLVTPPNGTVLDPFMGSGSTGKAAIYEGFNFVGIEMTDEYIPIAKARIEFAVNEMADKLL